MCNNKAAITSMVSLARSANRLTVLMGRIGHETLAKVERHMRDKHMASARLLKADEPRT